MKEYFKGSGHQAAPLEWRGEGVPESLGLTVLRHDSAGVAVVSVAGQLDRSNAHVIEGALSALDRDGAAVVSLLKCSYIDSSGLRALVRARKVLNEHIVLAVPAGTMIESLLHMTGLHSLFRIAPELPEAIELARSFRLSGDRATDGDFSGDPACWVERVCASCGALMDEHNTHRAECEAEKRINRAVAGEGS